MTTETDLRTALRSRAAYAPVIDPEQLLAELTDHGRPVQPVRSVAGRSHGRRWAVAGVAAGFVALAVASGLAVDGGHRADPAAGAGTASVDVPTPAGTTPQPVSTAPSPATGTTVNPYDPAAPTPLATDWVDADAPGAPYDPTAIVFSDDPIVASYVRQDQQLSILPGGGTRKDSSDAPWHTAVQVYLPGSGFEPASIGDPTPVTVAGVTRQCGTLPRLLDVTGPERVPSLLWQVDGAWVVLQIDRPAVPTVDQLAAAAARIDVHRGKG